MKKVILFIFLISIATNVSASSGALKQKSIVSCNNSSYGYHSSDKHYHEAYLKDDIWYGSGESLSSNNPCGDTGVFKVEPRVNEIVEVSFDKCVDGDTIKVLYENEVRTVRFLAIDTPETVHPSIEEQPFGKEASNFTCERVKNAKKLEIEFDADSEMFDKYDRLLGFVWVDDVLLQNELVKKGYATVAYLYGNYKHTKELQETEKIAKTLKLGVHSDGYDIKTETIEIEEEFDYLFISNYIKEKILKYLRLS